MKVVAAIAELIGIGLTLFGVAVVRASPEQVTEVAVEARRGIARWWDCAASASAFGGLMLEGCQLYSAARLQTKHGLLTPFRRS
ncbi:MAG: hypothetical protein ABJA87_09015 [bacterium]